jgi:hypothetical protein
MSPLGAQRSSLRCASGVKRSRPTNRVGHLNKRWEESLACGEKPMNTEKCFQHLVVIKGALSGLNPLGHSARKGPL